ncbi:hypothetical protein P3T76_008481 [Phytophthora citrophthora]|uniref:Uncharacterized protein n=1 Tax=Phytophthora citrophthora TaxID=4793 RepID=A0AAD9GKX6_9STRA|nr:hypothetical protein P3T76_008481 [Phytophthora citrophthora]
MPIGCWRDGPFEGEAEVSVASRGHNNDENRKGQKAGTIKRTIAVWDDINEDIIRSAFNKVLSVKF